MLGEAKKRRSNRYKGENGRRIRRKVRRKRNRTRMWRRNGRSKIRRGETDGGG